MTNRITRRARLGTALSAMAIALAGVASPSSAAQPANTYRPSQQVVLSVGEGQMVNLSRAVADVWVSNPGVADVHVSSPRQLNLFGKDAGEATVIATAKDGSVVYASGIRVSQNLSSINDVLRAAMPDADLNVQSVGQIAVITGTVASPDDSAFVERLVRAALNPGIKEGDPLRIVPVNRTRTATPLQVNVKVRIAEVNRTLLKQIGFNIFSSDKTGGTGFSVNKGNIDLITSQGGFAVQNVTGGSTLGIAGKVLGLDLIGSLDLLESDGVVTTLAEPNLTALSGETANFLAGGEFPIPISQGDDGITIEYKPYGVALAFTPIVLSDGRISMRIRPEVSELSNEGSLRLAGFEVPALSTRRAETTVELGSGQSFMLGGLLRNINSNTVDKAPFLGDLPVLGALFRSTAYRRQETELVIIVTPYLVRPVNGRMVVPTDGYRAPTDAQQMLLGQSFDGVSARPAVRAAPAPAIGGGAAAAAPGFKM